MKNNILQNSVVHYVNVMIELGIKNKVSDIHVMYDTDEVEVKYRKDGVLVEIEQLYEIISKKAIEKVIVEIVSRLKILSNMNVAEKRKPQDGSFSFLIDGIKYDIRSSYIPTVEGESIVLRILNSFLSNINFKTLGFFEKSENLIRKMLAKKYGMILISGPTGSGKSTTLLSMINELNDGTKKIIMVEDPVENRIKGITQIQVNSEIGVTFSEILKSCLRSDPDIIVISEIRDEITAEIAVRAALTGHLVISTVHTNDAISTIIRLVDMGIPKYLILDCIVGVIGQRLVSKKERGRIAVNEVLFFNNDVKKILKENNISNEIKEIFENKNSDCEIDFIDFKTDVENKILKGIIDKKEIYNFI